MIKCYQTLLKQFYYFFTLSINMEQFKMRHVILVVVFLVGRLVLAQASSGINVKVVKSKGKASIIKLPDTYSGELQPGLYTIAPATGTDATITEDSRGNSLSFSFESDFAKQVTKTTVAGLPATETTVDIKSLTANFFYGWNSQTFEYGPFLSYSFVTIGPSDTKAISAGLFADWNFISNNGQNNWIPGLRILGGAGQIDNSALKEAYGLSLVQAGLILKYFYFQSSFAITAEAAMKIEDSKPTGAEVKTTSTVARIGIINYF